MLLHEITDVLFFLLKFKLIVWVCVRERTHAGPEQLVEITFSLISSDISDSVVYSQVGSAFGEKC